VTLDAKVLDAFTAGRLPVIGISVGKRVRTGDELEGLLRDRQRSHSLETHDHARMVRTSWLRVDSRYATSLRA
jgi:hypothetical protein